MLCQEPHVEVTVLTKAWKVCLFLRKLSGLSEGIGLPRAGSRISVSGVQALAGLPIGGSIGVSLPRLPVRVFVFVW